MALWYSETTGPIGRLELSIAEVSIRFVFLALHRDVASLCILYRFNLGGAPRNCSNWSLPPLSTIVLSVSILSPSFRGLADPQLSAFLEIFCLPQLQCGMNCRRRYYRTNTIFKLSTKERRYSLFKGPATHFYNRLPSGDPLLD